MLSAVMRLRPPQGCVVSGSSLCRRFLSSSVLLAEVFAPHPAAGFKKRKRTLAVDLQSLERFRHMYGHLLVPQKFKFAEEEEDIGPKGTTLGKHVMNLRNIYTQSHTKAEPWIAVLNSLGFEWDAHEAQFRLLMRAILAYKEVYGDFLIPMKFVVPKYSRDFPQAYWGLPVGSLYHNLLGNKLTNERIASMNEMGVPTVGVLTRRAEKLLQAIEVYKRLNGQTAQNLYIPKDFCVNIYDEDWPEELWGYKLHQAAYNVACRGAFEEFHAQFEAAGLRFLPKEERDRRKQAVRKYNKLLQKAGKEFSLAKDLAES